MNPQTRKSILLALLSYFLWGFLPLFWHHLTGSTALQTLSHRILWSFVFSLVVLMSQHQIRNFIHLFKSPKIISFYAVTALLLATNWLIYIWAVAQKRVLESSLGYFILPLITVLLGVIFLKEKLRTAQWAILAIAAIGILYLSFQLSQIPWVALSLALSFSLYSLLKKNAPTNAEISISFEMGILLLPALIYLIVLHTHGQGVFIISGAQTSLMLIATGLVTIVPILSYSKAVPLLPLSLTGLMFYLNPTLQFLTGAILLKEPFTKPQIIGYSIIWIALILYFIEGWKIKNKKGV